MNRSFIFFAVVAAILIGGCGGTYEPTNPKDLAACYKTEFDTAPPPSVGSLQAKQVIVGDAGAQWLRFTADPNTVASLLSHGFESSDQSTFLSETGGANAPSWWQPSSSGLTTFYSHPNWKKHFGASSQSRAYLAHDADKKLVYFTARVWD